MPTGVGPRAGGAYEPSATTGSEDHRGKRPQAESGGRSGGSVEVRDAGIFGNVRDSHLTPPPRPLDCQHGRTAIIAQAARGPWRRSPGEPPCG